MTTKDKNLEKAIKNYPIGTRVLCLTGKSAETIIGVPFYHDKYGILAPTQENPFNNYARIYQDLTWATIISEPTITNFELW